MFICGLQKLSLLDYPGKLAATVFTGGCNLRCPFCHNASLVTHCDTRDKIPEDDVFAFLNKRRGLLDGVCVTGGEPLLQPDIEDFIIKIRSMGFLVKLDTNGTLTEKLADLIGHGLLDYVAMDIKNSFEKYPETSGVPNLDTKTVRDSVQLLLRGTVPYEFRTTLVKPLHTEADIEKIGRVVAGAENYFLQNFEDSGDLVGFASCSSNVGLSSFSVEETQHFRDILSQYAKNVGVRN